MSLINVIFSDIIIIQSKGLSFNSLFQCPAPHIYNLCCIRAYFWHFFKFSFTILIFSFLISILFFCLPQHKVYVLWTKATVSALILKSRKKKGGGGGWGGREMHVPCLLKK